MKLFSGTRYNQDVLSLAYIEPFWNVKFTMFFLFTLKSSGCILIAIPVYLFIINRNRLSGPTAILPTLKVNLDL